MESSAILICSEPSLYVKGLRLMARLFSGQIPVSAKACFIELGFILSIAYLTRIAASFRCSLLANIVYRGGCIRWDLFGGFKYSTPFGIGVPDDVALCHALSLFFVQDQDSL